jgi:hypothetical protein
MPISKDSRCRCNPNAAVLSRDHGRGYRRGRKRKGGEASSVEADNAIAGEDEESAIISCGKRADGPGGQPVRRCVAAKDARRVLQKAIGTSNPQSAGRVLRQAADVVAGEGRGVFVIEGFELNPIEAGDAAFGRDPDVTVAGLKYLMNAVLR